ncbi:hypothetical protein L915_17666 [Phytophthora nicotianae]|uniref:Uncharacterized protein n=1 Tax=Phytophthora nicotianae TaxID=4792 RepID=W2G0N5_PHYNI|nr:hypothetical protein L915_17666 [Phytophthora nicotianae]
MSTTMKMTINMEKGGTGTLPVRCRQVGATVVPWLKTARLNAPILISQLN